MGCTFLIKRPVDNALGNANPLRSRDFWNSHRSRADDAADHAARLASGHAARDTARNPSSAQIRRRFFFFDHLNFVWNLGRSAQLAVNNFVCGFTTLTGDAAGGGGGGGGGGGATRKVMSCVLGNASV